MRKFKKYIFAIVSAFLLLNFINPILSLNVNAANTTNTYLNTALSTAPQGIDLSNGRFKMPTEYTDGQPYSPAVSSNVISATNDLPNSNRIVQIVNGESQAGGIWGDPARNNYIDTTKKQTLSMWIYISKLQSGDTATADGLAFVLHNDPRGINAISSVGNKINVGETLGVWGIGSPVIATGASGELANTSAVAGTAIQNSWALEFDAHSNSDTYKSLAADSLVGEENTTTNNSAKKAYDAFLSTTDNPLASYDKDIPYTHIASGFPASPSTYTANPVTYYSGTKFSLLGKKYSDPHTAYYYSMNHTNTSNPEYNEAFTGDLFLKNSQWRHLTITIDIPDKKISYKYNDLNTDGTANTATLGHDIIKGTTNLSNEDIANLGIKSSGEMKDKLYYGFTGATGTNGMNGLVIFEQIPGFAETEVTPDFQDISSNKSLASTADTAYSGEELQLNYHLSYEDGNEPWSGVTSHIVLPKNVDFTADADGNVGTVTVGGISEKIPFTAIKDNILEYKLPSSMNTGDTSKATFSINGTAGQVTQKTTVASTHSKFAGDNGIANVDSPSFTIENPALKLTSTTDNPLTVNEGQNAKISGNVAYTATDKTMTNSNMTVHVSVNNNAETTFKMNNSDPIGQLTANISKDDLTSDTNFVRIYVTDADNNKSNTIRFTIKTKDGSLSLNEYPEDAYFKTVNTTKKDQVISRSGKWDLSILDSRGSGNNWKLVANSTTLKNDNSNFNGSLIYKTGNNSYSLTNNDIQIATGETISDDPVITDIDSTWTNDSGILLESDGANSAGTYKGTINWTLYDSI